jgi:hypothetical protein
MLSQTLHLIPQNHFFCKCSLTTHLGRRRGERMYSSYSFTTSALDGGKWSASRPGRALAPGKGPPVPIGQEAEWTPEPVWTKRLERKYFFPCRGSNLEHSAVQSAARHYTELPWLSPLFIQRDKFWHDLLWLLCLWFIIRETHTNLNSNFS